MSTSPPNGQQVVVDQQARVVVRASVTHVDMSTGRHVVIELETPTGTERYAMPADPAKQVAKSVQLAAAGIVLGQG